MNQKKIGLETSVSSQRPAIDRPEPEYVDEVFEDEVFSTDDSADLEPEETRTEPADSSAHPVRGSASTGSETPPGKAASLLSPRLPGPDHRVTGRSVRSRIPHHHAAPNGAVLPQMNPKDGPVSGRPESGPDEGTRPSAAAPRSKPAGPSRNEAAFPIRTPFANPEPDSDPVRTAPRGEAPIPAWTLLENVLKENTDLPEGSLILGVQDDGKPLVLALDDTSMGAVLIAGDSEAANRKHLRAILASAEKLSSPELLQVDVISRVEGGFKTDSSVLHRSCAASDPCVFEILGEYLEEIETRLREERQLPFRVLFLDEIEALTSRLAEDSLRFLRWMMRRGPQVGIWIFASIETARLPEFDLKTYRSFDLRLYGMIREKTTAERYTEIPPNLLKKLAPGTEACFKLDETVIRFSIPVFAST